MTGKYFDKMFDFLENRYSIRFTDMDKELMKNKAVYAEIPKKSFFIKEGEIRSRMAFVISGIMRSFYINDDGKECTTCFSFENDILSDASVNINKRSDSFTEALADCKLLAVDYASFSEMTANNITWLKVIGLIQEDIIKYREEREKSLISQTAEERYLQFLQQHPNIGHKIKQTYVASYLGMTPVSISKIKKILKN